MCVVDPIIGSRECVDLPCTAPAFITVLLCLVESNSIASTSSTALQSQSQNKYAFHGLPPLSASVSASSSTSATSSSPLQKLPCDVFINHRGSDVKHTLARAICNPLHAMGIRVFLDSEELQLGDFFPWEPQKAITSASIQVAIFSRAYAESAWCLAELSFMLKSGTPIIPVFYQVQPDDLRHVVQGKGIYAAAFLKHQEKGRYSKNRLEEWKMALHTVSFYKGERINNDDEEQRVLKNIVNRVLTVMKIVPLEVAKHPVGLDEAVADFETTVCESGKTHSNVQVVGIWGMGGSGKTTLAKEIYNRKCISVERSNFMFDVKHVANKNELHKKQIKLLQDLGFNHESFDNIEQGKAILSNHLRSVRVLIILDDVNHMDQLEALLPAKDSLAWGSLIILTTREREVLRCWGVSSIYKMKSMNRSCATQLFCWHAFLQPFPSPGFQELVEKFISVCNGLPLSLKILGSQLYCCSNNDLWENSLHKISKILPNDIKNRLKVSYDALDDEEKQMFLDIACFLIGKDKMIAIAVWDASGWSGLYGWERLVNKCLVDFENNNGIRMHDHLRDLGREIAKTRSPYRLWSPDQITGIQEQTEIRGMILNAATSGVHKFPAWLHGFKRNRGPSPKGLKVFVVEENSPNNLLISKLSKELAWLSCNEIAHRNLPSWLPLKNLRVIELYNSKKIVGLWKDGPEAPVQLRVLTVYNCRNLARIPKSIGYLEHLKKISLYYCNVESLPEEFCCLQSLLQQCEMLSSLPSCFGQLTNLHHLDLSSSYQLKMLPDSFKQLTLLQHLNLERCYTLTLQSDILENMTRLEYLNLNECEQLEELPHHITNQAPLSELYLKETRLKKLPSNIGKLSKLRVMEIGSHQGSFQVRSLPDSIGHLILLERLVLENLEVECLPKSLKRLSNLQILEIIQCPISILDFGPGRFISSLSNLKEIHLESTRVSKISISDDCCPGLLTLRLWDNEYLRAVQTLPTTMEDIQVDRCKLLRNISDCLELEGLPCFELKGGKQFEKIQGFTTVYFTGKASGTLYILEGAPNRKFGAIAEIADVAACIKEEKWPENIIICTKAVPGAGALLNSSAFPNLRVLHSFAKKKLSSSHFIKLQQKCFSNGNAIMLCLVINCQSPRMEMVIKVDHFDRICSTEVEEGKWVFIGAFSQHSRCLTAQNFYISKQWTESDSNGGNRVEKGFLVRGKEESVMEGFHRLLALLGC
ncbi:hypothetical protein SUGI_0721170 [Cryptomeria japonica]|nr:hypothetical protein SUGI_0721170 [Cryptomeria japonica]